MRKVITSIFIILIHHSVLAIDLNEALNYAYLNNDELKLIRTRFLNEIEKFPQAFSGFMPRVSASINSSNAKTKPNSQYNPLALSDELQSLQEGIVIEQPIFSGGSSIANLKAAQSAFRASRAEYYANEQQIIFNLIKAYLDSYEAKEKYDISDSSVKTNKQLVEVTEEKLKLGEANEIEIARARAQLAVAETNKLKVYAEFQAAKANFTRMFGIEFSNVELPTLPENLPNAQDDLVQKSIKLNPNIDSKRHSVSEKKANELAAKAQLLPKVSFRIQAARNYYTPENPYNNTLNSRGTTSTLSVNIPIYEHGGAEYSSIRSAKHNTRATVIQLDNTIKQIRAGALGSWEEFAAAKSRIIAASQGIEAAQVAYDGSVQEEIVGVKTLLEVLDAEEKLYQAKIAKVDALKASILAAYQMKALTGELTAKSLKLKVPYFSPEDEFKKLKKKLLIGF